MYWQSDGYYVQRRLRQRETMLHYKNRRNRIHIMTLDPVLLEDIYERLHEHPGLEQINLIKPGGDGAAIEPDDILKMARDTTSSRVIILDIRSQTRARLQHAYSDIIRFNRPDLNLYCYTVLVGDWPANFFEPDRGLKALPSFLAHLRIDFGAAGFYADPFLYHSMEELQDMALHQQVLAERISGRYEKYFRGDRPRVSQVRRYFRTADKQDSELETIKKERRRTLKKMNLKVILEQFPDDRELIEKALTRNGLEFAGETLRCYIYPFYFEKHILDLFEKSQAAT